MDTSEGEVRNGEVLQRLHNAASHRRPVRTDSTLLVLNPPDGTVACAWDGCPELLAFEAALLEERLFLEVLLVYDSLGYLHFEGVELEEALINRPDVEESIDEDVLALTDPKDTSHALLCY